MEQDPNRDDAFSEKNPHGAGGAPIAGRPIAQPMPPYYGYPPPPRSRSRWLWILLIILVPVAFVYMLMANLASTLGPQNDLIEARYNRERWKGKKKIAVIHIEGTIYETEGGFVKKQIDRIRQDNDVVGVVLRVDSPGGTVSASDFLLHHLKELRHRSEDDPLPLVVSMGSMAASGGYYVSMAVEDQPDSIFVEPTTWTGSIGVIIPHYSIEPWSKDYIMEQSIKSHELKGMGSIFKPLSDEEQAIFQGLVDDAFARFKEVVMSGRPELRPKAPGGPTPQFDKLATGQIFTARQALDSDLADKEGFMDDAIARCLELAQVEKDDAYVVYFKKQGSLFDGLLMESGQPTLDMKMLNDLATPKAFFLCTWMPGLAKGN